ncbi:MAG TPA: hypothetical protein DHW82_07295 [Spirochaetia bacterium]|nr:MAG: hypothetical protein A2Y41_00570 [Spirochaetes bacterium GWB1_36_13]HCL56797.1 hypothetical protein [Spirochaetia bacterium]
MDILVVGQRDSILGFKTIGIKTLFWEEKTVSLKALKQNIDEGSKIIFVTENLFLDIKELMSFYFGKLYPVFIPIPDITGSQGLGYENIRQLVIRALGTDIFGENEGGRDR